MKERKFLHVSCVVEDKGGIWHLLRSLEAASCGNVEIKPVKDESGTEAPKKVLLIAQDPAKSVAGRPQRVDPRAGKGKLAQRILKAMTPGEQMRPKDLAYQAGLKTQQVNQAMWNLERQGMLSRTAPGIYLLVVRKARAS